ncbi:MAG TPA: ParB N-terminal domain-containing protein [Chitinispirillaceae bacterium]|nr:ParB N-terminal domain-containing protein [Chitinispirillaceae bacterium]
MQKKQTAAAETLMLNIDNIDVSDNRELKEGNVLHLMNSIGRVGQLVSVLVTKDSDDYYTLIAGGHRLEAMRRLGFTTIKAEVFTGDDIKLAQLHENTIREGLNFVQKIEAAKWVQETLANPTGKNLKNDSKEIDNTGSQNSGNPQPAHTEDLVVEHGIFTNKETFRQAMKVYDECIPEVYPLIDSGALSIYYAYSNIIPVPKKKQKSLLHDIGADASVDKSLVRNKIKERLKKQRKEDAGVPENPDADPIYNVVRLAPDWANELTSDIEELPVNDYLSDVGMLFIECPNDRIATALNMMNKWGITFKAMVTVYSPKAPIEQSIKGTAQPRIICQKAFHILIGQKDPECCGATVIDTPAVLNRQKPAESLFEIIAEICPVENEMRLDLSGTESRDGWKVWKIDYAN